MKNFGTKLAVTFAVVLVAVLGVATVAGAISSGDDAQTASAPDIETPQYDTTEYEFDEAIGEADITMDSTVSDATVVIDGGPGASPRDVQPLTDVLTEHDNTVEFRGMEGPQQQEVPILIGTQSEPMPQPASSPDEPVDESLADSLAGADGYVGVAGSAYTDEDIEALSEFVDEGGSVLLLTDPQQSFSGDAAAIELKNELGVTTDSGYVYNLETNDLNYQRIFAESTGQSSLADGVDRAVFDTAQTVDISGGDEVFQGIDGTELSTTRAPADGAVLVEDDNVVVAGDTDFMSPENVLRADNDELVGNIADFLVASDRDADEQERADEDDDDDEHIITVAPDDQPIFDPPAVEIDEGDTVRFEWDASGYNLEILAQPDDADWEGEPDTQDEGHVHEHTFETEGIYEFQSSDHADQGMFGGVIVGDVDLHEEP